MPPKPVWSIEPHCCAVCLGRVLSRPLDDGIGSLYRCADCGAEREGLSSRVLCACGFKVAGRKNIGLRCEPNPEVTPEFPAEYIARQA